MLDGIFDFFSKAHLVVFQLAFLVFTIIGLCKLVLDQWKR